MTSFVLQALRLVKDKVLLFVLMFLKKWRHADKGQKDFPYLMYIDLERETNLQIFSNNIQSMAVGIETKDNDNSF